MSATPSGSTSVHKAKKPKPTSIKASASIGSINKKESSTNVDSNKKATFSPSPKTNKASRPPPASSGPRDSPHASLQPSSTKIHCTPTHDDKVGQSSGRANPVPPSSAPSFRGRGGSAKKPFLSHEELRKLPFHPANRGGIAARGAPRGRGRGRGRGASSSSMSDRGATHFQTPASATEQSTKLATSANDCLPLPDYTAEDVAGWDDDAQSIKPAMTAQNTLVQPAAPRSPQPAVASTSKKLAPWLVRKAAHSISQIPMQQTAEAEVASSDLPAQSSLSARIDVDDFDLSQDDQFSSRAWDSEPQDMRIGVWRTGLARHAQLSPSLPAEQPNSSNTDLSLSATNSARRSTTPSEDSHDHRPATPGDAAARYPRDGKDYDNPQLGNGFKAKGRGRGIQIRGSARGRGATVSSRGSGNFVKGAAHPLSESAIVSDHVSSKLANMDLNKVAPLTTANTPLAKPDVKVSMPTEKTSAKVESVDVLTAVEITKSTADASARSEKQGKESSASEKLERVEPIKRFHELPRNHAVDAEGKVFDLTSGRAVQVGVWAGAKEGGSRPETSQHRRNASSIPAAAVRAAEFEPRYAAPGTSYSAHYPASPVSTDERFAVSQKPASIESAGFDEYGNPTSYPVYETHYDGYPHPSHPFGGARYVQPTYIVYTSMCSHHPHAHQHSHPSHSQHIPQPPTQLAYYAQHPHAQAPVYAQYHPASVHHQQHYAQSLYPGTYDQHPPSLTTPAAAAAPAGGPVADIYTPTSEFNPYAHADEYGQYTGTA